MPPWMKGRDHYMALAAIYARYSSDRQRDESIEDQVRVCRAEAERNGDEVAAVYADHAISGTDAEHRPQFQRMVADSAEAPWEVVYVYKVDRFARNRYDSAVYKARLRKNGVRVVSATERIQDGPDGILLESLLEGMAEYYSANLSENIRRGLEGNALKCHHNGVAVYGYDNQPDGTVRVNEREAAVVRTIFRMWGAGEPTPAILDALKGERTRAGKPVSAAFVSKVLRNDRYIGTYRFAGHVVPNAIPAIVDLAAWDRAQARIRSRTRRGRAVKASYWLSGKLVGPNGERYHGDSGTGTGGRYTYYRCDELRHAVPQAEIEEGVAALVAEAFRDPGTVERICELVLEAQGAAPSAAAEELGAIDGRIRRLEEEYARLLDIAAARGMNEAISARMDRAEKNKTELLARKAQLQASPAYFDHERIEFWLGELSRTLDVRTIIDLFVSKVVLEQNGSYRVYLTLDEPDLGKEEAEPSGSDSSALSRVVEYRLARPNYTVTIRRDGFVLERAA